VDATAAMESLVANKSPAPDAVAGLQNALAATTHGDAGYPEGHHPYISIEHIFPQPSI
jgi:hypothetical protein